MSAREPEELRGCLGAFIILVAVMVISVLLYGCGGGSTSSGVPAPAPVQHPEELELLSPAYQSYVVRQVRGYRSGDYTSATWRDGFINLGPDWGSYGVLWSAGSLVHEACHIEYHHDGCVYSQEQLCNRMAADAMLDAGYSEQRDLWLSVRGSLHC